MINTELNVGDKIILLHMEGEMMSPGSKGVVTKISRDPFENGNHKIYSVKWEDGNSLSILSVSDAWRKIEDSQITENFEQSKWFMDNRVIVENFNTHFLGQYLEKVRQSGITNMFGASPYLYLGRERIEHEFKYKNIPNEEAFEEVLNDADKAQSEMIKGVFKVLEKNDTEPSLEKINRNIQRFGTLMVNYWTRIH
jgi:hypothetical protein